MPAAQGNDSGQALCGFGCPVRGAGILPAGGVELIRCW